MEIDNTLAGELIESIVYATRSSKFFIIVLADQSAILLEGSAETSTLHAFANANAIGVWSETNPEAREFLITTGILGTPDKH